MFSPVMSVSHMLMLRECICTYFLMQNRKSYVHLTTQPAPAPKRDEHHLFLKFSALALPVNEPCELFFFIYDAKVYKTLR